MKPMRWYNMMDDGSNSDYETVVWIDEDGVDVMVNHWTFHSLHMKPDRKSFGYAPADPGDYTRHIEVGAGAVAMCIQEMEWE